MSTHTSSPFKGAAPCGQPEPHCWPAQLAKRRAEAGQRPPRSVGGGKGQARGAPGPARTYGWPPRLVRMSQPGGLAPLKLKKRSVGTRPCAPPLHGRGRRRRNKARRWGSGDRPGQQPADARCCPCPCPAAQVPKLAFGTLQGASRLQLQRYPGPLAAQHLHVG